MHGANVGGESPLWADSNWSTSSEQGCPSWGGIWTIVAFKKEHHCFFVYGFEKNAKSNISENEEKAIKLIAKSLLAYTEKELCELIDARALLEIINEDSEGVRLTTLI